MIHPVGIVRASRRALIRSSSVVRCGQPVTIQVRRAARPRGASPYCLQNGLSRSSPYSSMSCVVHNDFASLDNGGGRGGGLGLASRGNCSTRHPNIAVSRSWICLIIPHVRMTLHTSPALGSARIAPWSASQSAHESPTTSISVSPNFGMNDGSSIACALTHSTSVFPVRFATARLSANHKSWCKIWSSSRSSACEASRAW